MSGGRRAFPPWTIVSMSRTHGVGEIDDLLPGVHSRVGAARGPDPHRLLQDPGKHLLHRRLDGRPVRLNLPPGVRRPVVRDDDANPPRHGGGRNGRGRKDTSARGPRRSARRSGPPLAELVAADPEVQAVLGAVVLADPADVAVVLPAANSGIG